MSNTDMDDQLRIGRGLVRGDKQVTLYYTDKPTLADLVEIAMREFPDVSLKSLKTLPGYGFLVLTEGDDFDVPKS